jgi:hypothetical protein
VHPIDGVLVGAGLFFILGRGRGHEGELKTPKYPCTLLSLGSNSMWGKSQFFFPFEIFLGGNY